MTQVLANIVAKILFPSVHYIVNVLLQKRSLVMKNEEIIKFFFLFLEEATLFPSEYP